MAKNKVNKQAQENGKERSSRKKFLDYTIAGALIGAFATVVAALISVYAPRPDAGQPSSPTSVLNTFPAVETLLPATAHTLVSSSTPLATSTPSMVTKVDDRGVEMILIPEDYFIMGSSLEDVLKECHKLNYQSCTENRYSDLVPSHEVYLLDYYIDKYEVTNGRYLECVNEGVCLQPKSIRMDNKDYFGDPEYNDYPVVHVDWYMAKNYCEWRGARLPTEAEWEKAARGMNGQTYPWGNVFDCKKGNFDDEIAADEAVVYGGPNCDGYPTTSPVGAFNEGVSPYGVYDMAGNVWEWVNSIYKPYPYNAKDGREDTDGYGIHIIRGGAWFWFDYIPAGYHRVWLAPNNTYDLVGFRCASDP